MYDITGEKDIISWRQYYGRSWIIIRYGVLHALCIKLLNKSHLRHLKKSIVAESLDFTWILPLLMS